MELASTELPLSKKGRLGVKAKRRILEVKRKGE